MPFSLVSVQRMAWDEAIWFFSDALATYYAIAEGEDFVKV
jgi:hypothetical protein